ncbi:LuxR C-terminal-related transcriptional regulator [Streptomyces longispororuber]|uniref:LuxR C-terminal-related transcriptional regulator n=1 Tax=Streptomyces longispororuber TaxID=68230 RepID=UPI0027E37D7A|nr:LuxR C-terminal-related transcriptional regulator [Streptomyces longispororuber]
MTGRFVLLLAAAAYETDPEGPGVDAGLVLRAATAAGLGADALDAAERAGLRRGPDGRLRLPDRRDLYEAVPPARRRAAHRLLAAAAAGERPRPATLLHRALALPCPDAAAGDELAACAREPGCASHGERAAVLAHAAALAVDPGVRADRLVAAADQARRAGRPRRARELLDRAAESAAPGPVRGRAALVHGLLALRDGPVADARESLLLAARLCAQDPRGPGPALDARLAAAEASWALGDAPAYLEAVGVPGTPGGPHRVPAASDDPGREVHDVHDVRDVRDYRLGMSAALGDRFGAGRAALARVVERAAGEGRPDALLRAGAAALVGGDVDAACRLGSRALAAARAHDAGPEPPRALELLAYAELRSGRHARARAHAEEGLRCAHDTGQRNVLAHLHAVLALVASLDCAADTVARHARAAQDVAARHGLAQAATLAEWALARADLARGRAPEAASRLGPLVRPGPGRGHFAVRLLAVPDFVEAVVLAGEPGAARTAVTEFTAWAERGHDPQAPAQLARCQALSATGDPAGADARYAEALARHDRAGGDYERARTAALYGKWLRRSRRPARARALLRDALVAFERCGATVWAAQTAAELRATGEAPGQAEPPGRLAELTPQQLRIARCVAEGDTNREVARRLSVSPRTVDHHLRNVFAQLGVRSRTELARLVDRAERATAPS